jgi:hypothetical protein
MSSERFRPGYIRTPDDAQPRPLTEAEAQHVFAALAAREDEIAFAYLWEGCECRAQLMIEHMEALGIDPGRTWAVSVGRPLAVANPVQPKKTIKWGNHTAPTVAVDAVEYGVLVIDPSLSRTEPMTLAQWAGMMRARSIEVSEVPLSQAEILSRQTARALAGQDLDAIVFSLARGQAPIPERGGSGFVLGPDPAEGLSAYAHRKMIDYLAARSSLQP